MTSVIANNFTLANVSQDDCQWHDDNTEARIAKAWAYCMVIFFAFIGNTIVIFIYCKHRSMRSTTNRLILNMAASDLLMPVLVLPRHLSVIFEKGPLAVVVWHIDGIFGEIMCKLIPFLSDVSYVVSIFSLVLIAFDRYLAVVWPMSKGLHFTPFRCKVVIAGTWLAAFAIHSPYLKTFYLYQSTGTSDTFYCLQQWQRGFDSEASAYNSKASQIYFLIAFTLLYVLPLILITVLYVSIIIELGANTRKNAQNNPVEVGRRRRREDKKVITMLVMVLSVFAIFYAPMHVCHFVSFFVWGDKHCGLNNLLFAAYFLSHLPCAITPYIYFIFIRNYRHGFKEVSRYCFRRDLQSQESRTHNDGISKISSRFTSDVQSTSVRSNRVIGKNWRLLHAPQCCLEASKTTPDPTTTQFETCL